MRSRRLLPQCRCVEQAWGTVKQWLRVNRELREHRATPSIVQERQRVHRGHSDRRRLIANGEFTQSRNDRRVAELPECGNSRAANEIVACVQIAQQRWNGSTRTE